MSHTAAAAALYADVATVLRKSGSAGSEVIDGKLVVENSARMTVKDVLNQPPVTSVSQKLSESKYYSPYELYHDLKLVTAVLLSKHEIGTKEYNELRDLFSASVDLLLREGVRLYGMLPREPVQTADSFLSLIRQGLEDVFTDVQGYYGEAFYLVAQNGPLFTTQTGKSPADPRPTLVGGPIHSSKLIPLVAPAPTEVMGFAVPPPDARTAPLPTATPTAMLDTFVPLNRTPLISSKWIQGDVYTSFAPTRDTSDALVASEDAAAVWFENAASQAIMDAEENERRAKSKEPHGNGTVKQEPHPHEQNENNGSELPPVPAGPTAPGFNGPSISELPPVPAGPTAPITAPLQSPNRLPPDMPPPPASLYSPNGPMGAMPPPPASVAAGLAGHAPLPPPPAALSNGRNGPPTPPGGRPHGMVDMVEELLNGSQQAPVAPATPAPEMPKLPNGIDIDAETLLQWKPSNFIDDDEFEASENGTETQLAAKLLLELQTIQRERLAEFPDEGEPSEHERHIAFKIENILARLAGDASGPSEASNLKVSTKIPVLLKNYVGTLPSGAPPKLPPPPPIHASVPLGGGVAGMPNRLASISRGPNGQVPGAPGRPRLRR